MLARNVGFVCGTLCAQHPQLHDYMEAAIASTTCFGRQFHKTMAVDKENQRLCADLSGSGHIFGFGGWVLRGPHKVTKMSSPQTLPSSSPICQWRPARP